MHSEEGTAAAAPKAATPAANVPTAATPPLLKPPPPKPPPPGFPSVSPLPKLPPPGFPPKQPPKPPPPGLTSEVTPPPGEPSLVDMARASPAKAEEVEAEPRPATGPVAVEMPVAEAPPPAQQALPTSPPQTSLVSRPSVKQLPKPPLPRLTSAERPPPVEPSSRAWAYVLAQQVLTARAPPVKAVEADAAAPLATEPVAVEMPAAEVPPPAKQALSTSPPQKSLESRPSVGVLSEGELAATVPAAETLSAAVVAGMPGLVANSPPSGVLAAQEATAEAKPITGAARDSQPTFGKPPTPKPPVPKAQGKGQWDGWQRFPSRPGPAQIESEQWAQDLVKAIGREFALKHHDVRVRDAAHSM